jgi:hypothetical protein
MTSKLPCMTKATEEEYSSSGVRSITYQLIVAYNYHPFRHTLYPIICHLAYDHARNHAHNHAIGSEAGVHLQSVDAGTAGRRRPPPIRGNTGIGFRLHQHLCYVSTQQNDISTTITRRPRPHRGEAIKRGRHRKTVQRRLATSYSKGW